MPHHHRILIAVLGLCSLTAPGCTSIKAMLGGSQASHYQEPSPAERRQAFVDAHSELTPPVREAILAGAIVEGMGHEEVRASLGRPLSEGSILPETPEGGDESWAYEEVAFGTRTEFLPNGPKESRTFSGVRDTVVRFYRGKVVGVDDLGYSTRDQLEADCHAGAMETCDRLASLDSRAASQPPA